MLDEYDKAKDFVRQGNDRRAAKTAREKHEGLRRNIPSKVEEIVGDMGSSDDIDPEMSYEASENYDTNISCHDKKEV